MHSVCMRIYSIRVKQYVSVIDYVNNINASFCMPALMHHNVYINNLLMAAPTHQYAENMSLYKKAKTAMSLVDSLQRELKLCPVLCKTYMA